MNMDKSVFVKREGTSFQGLLLARYTDLVALYGKPLRNPRDHKTDAEWVAKTPYGVATIYNYKNGKSYLGNGGIDMENICEWHVGAKNPAAYVQVRQAVLDEARKRFTG